MDHPFLVSDRIYLRGLEETDIDTNYFQWFNDIEICRYNSHHRFPNSRSRMQKYIDSVTQGSSNLVLAIVLKNNDQHIGNISLQNINYIDRNAELALILGEKDSWGHGFGKEACKLIMNHGFKELNLKRIYCATEERNVGMQRLAEKLGMIQEGIRRKAVYKDSEFRDVIEYGVLREEFFRKE